MAVLRRVLLKVLESNVKFMAQFRPYPTVKRIERVDTFGAKDPLAVVLSPGGDPIAQSKIILSFEVTRNC